MKKLAAWLLALLLLTGCAPDAPPAAEPDSAGDSSRDPAAAEPVTASPVMLPAELAGGFDPYATGSACNRLIMELVLEPLFTQSADGVLRPVLAESYTVSEDGLTTRVRLREGIVCHDGTAFDAQKVIGSMDLARKGRFYAGRFHAVESVTAETQLTVIFTTTQAYECFPLLLDIPMLCTFDGSLQGTGAYVYSQTRLTPFDAWWGEARPAGDAPILLEPVTSAANLQDGFQYGGISAAAVDPNGPGAAVYGGENEVWSVPTTSLQYVGFNLETGVFSSRRVREAVTWAIDRDRIVREDMNGFGTAVYLPARPGSSGDVPELISGLDFVPALLEDVLPAGRKAVMLVSGESLQRQVSAGRIARQLTACGLETTLRVLPAEEFQAALEAGNFDLYYGETRLPSNQELTAFFTPGSALAVGGLERETQALTLCALALSNRGNAYDLQNCILTQGLLCPVAFKSTACYVRPGIFTGTAPQLNGWLWR